MNKLLWSEVTIETRAAIKEVIDENIPLEYESGFVEFAYVNLIMDSMLIHNSNGDHVYYYNPQSYKSRVKYYTLKALPFLRSLNYYSIGSSGFVYLEIPKSDDKTIKTFSGDNDGMTEISPINATIGSITSPNTKSKYKAENTQNETYIKFENEKSRVKMLSEDYANAIKYFHSIFVNLIVEWHRIY